MWETHGIFWVCSLSEAYLHNLWNLNGDSKNGKQSFFPLARVGDLDPLHSILLFCFGKTTRIDYGFMQMTDTIIRNKGFELLWLSVTKLLNTCLCQKQRTLKIHGAGTSKYKARMGQA